MAVDSRTEFCCACLLVGLGLTLHHEAAAQGRRAREVATPGPMLAQGTVDFDTPDFDVSLVRSSQTVAALKPKGADGFDFTPGDLLVERSKNGYYHLGDIDFRLRAGTSGDWKSYSTAVFAHACQRPACFPRYFSDRRSCFDASLPIFHCRLRAPGSWKTANLSCDLH